MMKLKTMVISMGLLIGSMSSTALADSMLEVSGNLGLAYLMPDSGDSASGVGLDVALGFPMGLGLVPEVMIGYTVNDISPFSFNNLMVMGGARFDFPISVILEPFVYAHVGLCNLSLSYGSDTSDSTAYFGLNAGGGVRYMVADTVGVGISAGPVFVFADDMLKYIRGNVHALIRL